METNTKITLSREVEAIQIPSGDTVTLTAGTPVIITQSLGGTYTEQIKCVYDPEIPVNIVDLGLVYDCRVVEEEGKKNVEVKMTLTAPGCGMGPTIAADAQSKIMTIDGIDDAKVELVWEPAWNDSMVSEEGNMILGRV